MKSILNFLKLTLLGGVLFVLPVLIIYILLVELLDTVIGLAESTAEITGIQLPEALPHP